MGGGGGKGLNIAEKINALQQINSGYKILEILFITVLQGYLIKNQHFSTTGCYVPPS